MNLLFSACKAKTLAQFLPLSPTDKTQCVVEKTKYLKRNDDDITLVCQNLHFFIMNTSSRLPPYGLPPTSNLPKVASSFTTRSSI